MFPDDFCEGQKPARLWFLKMGDYWKKQSWVFCFFKLLWLISVHSATHIMNTSMIFHENIWQIHLPVATYNKHTNIFAIKAVSTDAVWSHLVFLLPEIVQSDVLHRTVIAQFAAKYFLEHADEVNVVLCLHCIVMVKVQEHHLHKLNIKHNQLVV